MTREEKLGAMRTKDLVAYAQKIGAKVSQTRGMLKESRASAIRKIIAAENMATATVNDLVNEFNNLPDDAPLEELATKLELLSVDDQMLFMEMITDSLK